MHSIWETANPQLRDLAVYQPGKPIEETARELGCRPDEIIKLASNENPLGPSPRALYAIRDSLDWGHVYPDGGAFYLREAIAARIGCTLDEVIVGNGSNEVIEFLGHVFLQPGSDIIASQHAFVVYKLVAKAFGARTIEIPARDFAHDLDAMANAITPQTRIVFVANPNNPTGTLLPQEAIDRFMSRVPDHVIVCFDEAYYEYVDHPPDTLKFVRDSRNVIVLRTFSKIHGLASLRVGYGIAHAEFIAALQKARQPFNVNGFGQTAARAALTDLEHEETTKRLTDEGRAFLQECFAGMQLQFVPSYGNFVLVNVGDGRRVFRDMLRQRVIVRAMGGYDLAEWVRISVGTKEENERCIAALKQVLAK